MKTIVSLLILAISASSFASTSTFECFLVSNPKGTALVAGTKFQIKTDSNFGINGYYQHKVVVQSKYLGTCEGLGSENLNPLAEGFLGVAIVAGAKCAAEEFDIYMSPEFDGAVQVGSEDEAVFYNCLKK
ncbi:MAG: hypothetical protein H7328_02375 [Bdellovibrio sp.]|nr:hypothetical protein [Bdellovibrio sp.]